MRKAFIASAIIVAALGVSAGFSIRYFVVRLEQRNAAREAAKKTDISVTVVEGKRREEIADQLQKAGVTSAADFLSSSTNLEGQLFPDTYRFFPNSPASEVVQKMHDDYLSRVGSQQPTLDQLVLASIVEREASSDAQRPIIAAVYLNRLRIGMKLQSDPTVQYAKDSQALAAGTLTSFWQPITQGDYQTIDSPYNTYLINALPPAPICNPGLASIQAAMHPASIDPNDVYFVVKNDQLLLAKTLAQHNAQAAE